MAGAGAMQAKITRLNHRELRLAAMKAMRQVLASLHSSLVIPANNGGRRRHDLGDISYNKASSWINSALTPNGDYKEKAAKMEAIEGHEDPSSDASAKKTVF